MDELNRKIDGMVADLQTRVQTVQEQATAATELKTETHNLLEAVRAAAETAGELVNAVKGGVETQRKTLASGKRAMEKVAGEAKTTVTTLKNETESTLQKLQGKVTEFEEMARQVGGAAEKISAEVARALGESADELRTLAAESAAAARRNSETIERLERQLARMQTVAAASAAAATIAAVASIAALL